MRKTAQSLKKAKVQPKTQKEHIVQASEISSTLSTPTHLRSLRNMFASEFHYYSFVYSLQMMVNNIVTNAAHHSIWQQNFESGRRTGILGASISGTDRTSGHPCNEAPKNPDGRWPSGQRVSKLVRSRNRDM